MQKAKGKITGQKSKYPFNFALLFLLFIFTFLLFGVLSAEAKTIDELRAEIQRYEQEIERLKKEQDKLGQSIATTQEEARTLQNELNRINGQIKYMNNQIYLTNVEINKTGAEITNVTDEIYTTAERIDYQKSAIGELLLEIHKQDEESLLVAVMKNANISDFLNRIQQTADVSESLVTLVNDLKSTKNSYENHKTTLESKKQELEYLSRQQTSQKLSLSATQQDKNNLLNTTKGRETEYQKLLTEAEELERQVNLQIFRLEDELRRTIDPDSLPLARPGVLGAPIAQNWVEQPYNPTQPYGCVPTPFARRYYPTEPCGGKAGFHNGYDLAAPYGTPIFASEDGTVIAVGKAHPCSYGVWAAIEHDNGLVTAYTHMSVRNVSIGQQLNRGDVVGKMGSTGLSTGSHIHFMVYDARTFTTTGVSCGIVPIGANLNPSDYL